MTQYYVQERKGVCVCERKRPRARARERAREREKEREKEEEGQRVCPSFSLLYLSLLLSHHSVALSLSLSSSLLPPSLRRSLPPSLRAPP